MRTTADRIRHAISFEVIGLVLVTPLISLVFGEGLAEVGFLAFVGATLAMGWNYLYNLLFDHALLRLRGHVGKGWGMRIFHALLFEAGLLAALLPFVVWWLQVGWLEALMMDLSFASFYVVYAFIFNLGYDRIFPVPGLARG